MATTDLAGLSSELKDILEEVSESVYAAKEKGLDIAADYMLDQFEQATPVKTGKTKSMWVRTTKYKNVRYLYNLSLTPKNIPIVNLLEYSSKGKPFLRKTFAKNENKIVEMIQGEIKNA